MTGPCAIAVEPVIAHLALGSNLGDRQATIRSAIEALGRAPGIHVVSASSLHETEPVGVPGQNRYINAAVIVKTTLSPRHLLNVCLAIEQAHGRRRFEHERWGPRTLDIDLLLYADQIIDDPGPPRLRVPHPRMTERLFVLDPLAEIAPHVVHPVLRMTISAIRDGLRQQEYGNAGLCSR